jgi:hypothetical protein
VEESINSGVLRDSTPDVILPSQFFGRVGARSFSSEQRLMFAVLVDAINLILQENRRNRVSLEASSWLNTLTLDATRSMGSFSSAHASFN